jgi:hypothetical protein
MKTMALVLCGVTALLVASCQGEADVSATHVGLESSPATPHAGEPVTVTVTAYNDQLRITTVAVDFTDDGTFDETQSFDARTVVATFTHAYPAPGTYDVRATVTDASGAAKSKSMQVAVTTAPQTVPVFFDVNGVSPQDGRCFALGPPATCPGCALLVGTSAPIVQTFSLGQQPHGAHVSVDQGFNQWPIVFGDQTYRCDFNLHVYAGEPGHERGIGNGTCATSSLTRPTQLDCRISVSGAVP